MTYNMLLCALKESMTKDLYQLAGNVETEQDFLGFVEALMQDRDDE